LEKDIEEGQERTLSRAREAKVGLPPEKGSFRIHIKEGNFRRQTRKRIFLGVKEIKTLQCADVDRILHQERHEESKKGLTIQQTDWL